MLAGSSRCRRGPGPRRCWMFRRGASPQRRVDRPVAPIREAGESTAEPGCFQLEPAASHRRGRCWFRERWCLLGSGVLANESQRRRPRRWTCSWRGARQRRKQGGVPHCWQRRCAVGGSGALSSSFRSDSDWPGFERSRLLSLSKWLGVWAVTSDPSGWFSGWRRADSRLLCRLLGLTGSARVARRRPRTTGVT